MKVPKVDFKIGDTVWIERCDIKYEKVKDLECPCCHGTGYIQNPMGFKSSCSYKFEYKQATYKCNGGIFEKEYREYNPIKRTVCGIELHMFKDFDEDIENQYGYTLMDKFHCKSSYTETFYREQLFSTEQECADYIKEKHSDET